MTKPEHCIETFSRVVNKAGLKRGAKIGNGVCASDVC